MVRLSDTSPEAQNVLTEIYRKMPMQQKWQRLDEMYRDGRMLHALGVRLRNPKATPRDILQSWLAINFGFTQVDQLREPPVDQSPSYLREARAIIGILVQLDIPYALGGSMASSVYGVDRHTKDADIVVDPFPGKEDQLVAWLSPTYYVSLPAVQDALRQRSSFNLINTSTGFKADIFIRKDDLFEQSAMARRRSVTLADLPQAPGQPIVLVTAEDIILFKLRWYRLGNEASEQQWTDILGVLRTQAGKLEEGYLDRWAEYLKVADLLARARREAGA